MNIKEISDKKTVRDMENLIDPTGFRTIVNYLYSKDTEINCIFAVQNKDDLAHVGSIMSGAVKTIMTDLQSVLFEMLQKKIIRKVLLDTEVISKEIGSLLISDINPKQFCYALMLPPAYIIWMEEGRLYK